MDDSREPDPSSSADAARVTAADVGALPPGTRIDDFEVRRVLGSGGFGIVYLAYDHVLQREVALKEYFPATMAGRAATGRVTVRAQAMAETYDNGLRSFVNEARLLARFDHPSLVKVHRFWEAHGTAYMVMPYYPGSTLLLLRRSMSLPPEEAWLRRVQDGLLGALEVLHADLVYHRDVSPDNIVMLPGGAPVLLDFGAARRILAGQTRLLTAVIKPRYAPIEQYADLAEDRQGPWTDVYATAATLYFCLVGHAPPNAATRIVQDDYRPLRGRRELLEPTVGRPFRAAWLDAIDWALSVKPQDRPQSIAQWREALDADLPRDAAAPVAAVDEPLPPLPPLVVLGPGADDDHEPTLAPPAAPLRGPAADEPIEPVLGPPPMAPLVFAAQVEPGFGPPAATAPGMPMDASSGSPPAAPDLPELTAEARAYAPTEYAPRGAALAAAPAAHGVLAGSATPLPARRDAEARDEPLDAPMTAEPLARTPAPLPGPGRRLGWHWLAALMVLAAAVLGLMLLLESGI